MKKKRSKTPGGKIKTSVPSKPDSVSTGTNDKPKMPFKRKLLFLTVPYLVFIFLLLVIEIGTRVFLPHVSTLEAFVKSDYKHNFYDRENVTIFEGDPLLYWKLKPNLNQVVWDFTMVSTNSDGLRQPSEIESKKSDTLRIVCLGDSVTFGYRVPVVWADKPNNYDRNALPYPQWLEKQLRAANPGKKIETITLAVPGYSSYQGLLWLKDKIDDLDPDIVIACFGWNDIGTRPVSDKDMMKVGWKDVTLRRLMSVSQAVTHLTEWLNKKRGKDAGNVQQTVGPFVQRVSKEDYVSNFLEMSKLAKERKISFVAVGPVYRDSVSNAAEANLIASYRNALREKMAEAGTPYWEIKELLESNYPETEKLFGEAIHPNNIGHQVIANSLSSFLSSQGMLTKK